MAHGGAEPVLGRARSAARMPNMEVRGPGGVGGLGPIHNQPPNRVPKADDKPPSVSSEDNVQISPQGKLLSEVNQMLDKIPDVRQDKIDAVRRLIAEGTYETPEKIDIAVDRLLPEIMEE